MRIKFNKKYPYGATNSEVIKDFLNYLSNVYEYQITEYSCLTLYYKVKLDQLAPLVNAGNKVATALYSHLAREMFEAEFAAVKIQEEVESAMQALPRKLATRTEV